MNLASIPTALRKVIDNETTDFIIKANRKNAPNKFLGLLIFGGIWTGFSSLLLVLLISPLLTNGVVHFEMNGIPTSATLDNLSTLLAPGLFIGCFILIGLAILAYGMYGLFQKGGYFAATPSRLIQYRNGEIEMTDWEQFSGNIRLKDKGELGYLVLELRTGKMVSRGDSGNRYIPKQIEIAGIPNVYKIEKYCRERIKENDPTPIKRGYRS